MKLLLFDVDGTLVSLKKGISRGIFIDAFLEILNIEVEDKNLPNMSGMTDLSILAETAYNANIPKNIIFDNIEKFWNYFDLRFEELVSIETMKVHNGVKELLEKLQMSKEFRLALLTGNYKRNAYRKIKFFDLDKYFDIGAFGDDDINRNKLPEIVYSRAHEIYGEKYDSTNSIIIGDAPNDIICAKHNKLPSLIVASDNHKKAELYEMNPSHLIDDFSDIEFVIDLFRNMR